MERRSRRAIPHRLERCGYVSVKNPDATDDYWMIQKTRQPVYANAESNFPEAKKSRPHVN